MKDLNQIELEYCQEIFEFFCREYKSLCLKDNWSAQNQQNFIDRFKTQLDRRLVANGLIIDFRIDLDIKPLSERRNVQIGRVFGECDEIPEDKVVLTYIKKRGEVLKWEGKL